MDKRDVLFICTGNSVRSQMAEAFLRHHGSDYFNAYSAGSSPLHIYPLTRKVMEEIGISLDGHYSKSLDEFKDKKFDYVIVLCEVAALSCPTFPGKYEKVNWFIDDPIRVIGSEEKRLTAFRTTRDIIKQKVVDFISERAK
jgi:arsenate reductase